MGESKQSQEMSAKLIEAVDSSFAEQVDLTRELVSIPSVSGEEGPVASRLAGWFAANAFEHRLETVDPALRERHPELVQELELEARPNVFGWLRSPQSQIAPVVLNGHTDVVDSGPRELWHSDPFEGIVRDDRLWGRGAADMKGPLACGLFALRALRAAEIELAFDVEVQCVIGEERSGIGSLSAIDTEPTPSSVVVLEPTGGRVCAAGGGSAWFSVKVPGKAAHACVAWLGASSFEHAIAVYQGLLALERERNARISHPLFDSLPSKAPLAIGTVVAGEWPGTVPDTALLRGRIGLIPGETMEDLRAEVAETVAATSAGHPFLAAEPARISWDNEGYAPWETRSDEPMIQALLTANRAIGGKPGLVGVTYGSDAGHFAKAGFPTVLFGPGDIAHAHMKDESVGLAELRQATRALALALAERSAALTSAG